MNVAQINLLCADPGASRRFYEALGLTFRSISPPGQDEAAYLSDSGGTTLALHSLGFAQWWDPSTPGLAPGAAVLDFDVPKGRTVDEVLHHLATVGGTVAKKPEDMEFGERYAIVTDPDGHRLGLRQPIRT